MLVPESLNHNVFAESLLLSDMNLGDLGNFNFQNGDDDYLIPNTFKQDDDSIAQSYNQKVKEDTNYLAK